MPLHQLVGAVGPAKELSADLENPAAPEPGGRAVLVNRELFAVTSELAPLTAEWENATAALTLA